MTDEPSVWLRIFLFNSARYLTIAGLAFLLFYIIFKKYLQPKKLQSSYPTGKDYRREITYSFLSFIIFAFVGVAVARAWIPGVKIYREIEIYGWGYFIFSIVFSLFVHDTYFYWTHRAMHHPKLFRAIHLVHHKSKNPSPWASFSFSPLESFIQAFVIVLITWLIPMHPMAILVFLIIMTIDNVYGHLGWELYPRSLHKTLIGKWINTSVNHNMHHKYNRKNYGLYFRFWDELMGTTHEKYMEKFEKSK